MQEQNDAYAEALIVKAVAKAALTKPAMLLTTTVRDLMWEVVSWYGIYYDKQMRQEPNGEAQAYGRALMATAEEMGIELEPMPWYQETQHD